MSEEEIERLKNAEEYSKLGKETLLDTIHNQEKEIEELKEITKTYDSYIGEKMPVNSKIIIADREYFMNGTFVNKFISKDKIREKLENYKILAEKSLTRETLYIYKNIIYVLERLLEE